MTVVTLGLVGALLSGVVLVDKPTAEDRALTYLKREVPRWAQKNKCYSCHNNGDAARALYRAVQHGHRVPRTVLANTNAWLVRPTTWDRAMGKEEFKDRKLARLQFAATLAEAVASGRVKDRKALLQAADLVAHAQHKDGFWKIETGGTVGSPATHGTALATHLACRTLRQADARKYAPALKRAGQWFRTVEVKRVLDAAAVLWALSKAKDRAAQKQKAHCLTLIRKGESKTGGWGPFVTSGPEPFDTAVVVLALGNLPPTVEIRAMRQRGRRYLLRTQLKDGSWPETTRPAEQISYAQRLSTAGWATWALLDTGKDR